jgi:acetyl esterase/lipase
MGPCGNPGCARWGNGPDADGHVWVMPQVRDPRELLLHELGHIFDGRVMTAEARADWKRAIDDHRSGWMIPQTQSNGDAANVCGPSCEWFAEGYKMCAVYGPHITEPVYGIYGYTAGPKRQRRGCRVIRKAARGLYAAAASGSQGAVHEAPAGPLVLLLPGGGWQRADPATMDPWVRDFRQHGIRARAITYPLKDVAGAIEYVRRVAEREPGPVVAYGISAGGTIAAALAAQGAVAGAVNIAGPTDFERWVTPSGIQIKRQIGMRTRAQMRAASPYWMLAGHQSPQLVQCGAADPLVSFDQCQRYAAAAFNGQPDTRLQAMAAAHNQWSVDRARAREWIAARWPT